MSKALICFPAWFDMVMWRFVMLKQISKNEHFRNLVQLALDNNVLFQYILADSWFGSMANMYFIHLSDTEIEKLINIGELYEVNENE